MSISIQRYTKDIGYLDFGEYVVVGEPRSVNGLRPGKSPSACRHKMGSRTIVEGSPKGHRRIIERTPNRPKCGKCDF